jgi:hypothetical protein
VAVPMQRLGDTHRDLIVDYPDKLVFENQVLRILANLQGIEWVIRRLGPRDHGNCQTEHHGDSNSSLHGLPVYVL